MNKLFLVLVFVPILINALGVEDSFSNWVSLHNKQYANDAEYAYRLSVYQRNLQFIEEHNRKNVGFTVAMNQYGDLTSEEFAQLFLSQGFNASEVVRTNEPHVVNRMYDLPEEVDWRQKGVVTPVKNQGQCGSCWAFSTTGSVEGQHAIKNGQLVSLSEQNLVDCSTSYGNYGCNGGLMDSAFKYIIANNGIDTEASYPYEARDGTCRFKAANVGATISSYKDVQQGSESALQDAVANVGPVSVAIDASHMSFQFYSNGIYNEKSCSSTRLDHGVLAVGYGSENGKDYWLVKNSWGTSWGMSGYIKMSRNVNNQCGIATMSSYPVV